MTMMMMMMMMNKEDCTNNSMSLTDNKNMMQLSYSEPVATSL